MDQFLIRSVSMLHGIYTWKTRRADCTIILVLICSNKDFLQSKPTCGMP